MSNSCTSTISESDLIPFIEERVETKSAFGEMENADHVNPIFSPIKPVKCYVSKGGREKELHHINSIWSEDHRDEPERIKKVRFFEAKNRVMHIPKSAAQPPKCTLETIEEGLEIETDKVEHEDQVSSSTPLSAKPAASMAYQRTLEPIEEEEVEVEASFDGEAASDDELHDPTMMVNAKNQVPITVPVAMQPSSSRDFNTSANQFEVTLSKSRLCPSECFISGKKPMGSYLERLRKRMGGDVTNIRKLTASLRKEKKEKKMYFRSLLRTKQQHQHSAMGCSPLGVTGDSATDTEEDEAVFEATVEPLVENVIEEAKQGIGLRRKKELASTLDGRYWAVAAHPRRCRYVA